MELNSDATTEANNLAADLKPIILAWLLLPRDEAVSLPTRDKKAKAQFTGPRFAEKLHARMDQSSRKVIDSTEVTLRLTKFGRYLLKGNDLSDLFAALNYLNDAQKTTFKGILFRNHHENSWNDQPPPQLDANAPVAAMGQPYAAAVNGVIPVALPILAAAVGAPIGVPLGAGGSDDSSQQESDEYDDEYEDEDYGDDAAGKPTWSKGIPSVEPPTQQEKQRFASDHATQLLIADGIKPCPGNNGRFPVLGSGGFADEVLEADHPTFGICAVKFIPVGKNKLGRVVSHEIANKTIDAIENEANALQRAQHRSVVRYFDHKVPPKRDVRAYDESRETLAKAEEEFEKKRAEALMATKEARIRRKERNARKADMEARKVAKKTQRTAKAALDDAQQAYTQAKQAKEAAIKAQADARAVLLNAEEAKYAEEELMKEEAISLQSDAGYICMELLSGGTLWDFMRTKTLDEDTIKDIFYDLVLLLVHLHGLPLYHRDIKLDNIFLDTSSQPWTVKLGDFGAACDNTAVPIFATLRYAPAEIIKNALKDPAAQDKDAAGKDVFCLGVALYMMFIKQHPFLGDEARKIARARFSTRSREVAMVVEREIILGQQQLGLRIPGQLPPHPRSHAHNLLCAMLNADPKQRLSLDQILHHAWLEEKNGGVD